MPTPRFYHPHKLGPGTEVALSAAAAHHAARVLRMQAGDAVVLFDGNGGEYPAVLTRVAKSEVAAKTGTWRAAERESPLPVTLAQGIAAGDKMDFILQKAGELGVARIQPLAMQRSVVKLSGERAQKRVEHWQGVVIAACEQCRRNRVPPVLPAMPLDVWLAETQPGTKLLLSPDAETALAALPRPQGALTLLIGPEGGLAPEERKLALTQGYTAVRLGPRVLRTETAALAALAAMQALWGDFSHDN
ncbi:MAG: 16S rRNA (uracil(1498)-N(3))-methyltransferase [Pseudomonadota bacterium]